MNGRGVQAAGLKLSLALLACLTVSGCWDRNELNELGIITATGIDWEDGKWTATTQIVLPISTTGEGSMRQLTLAPVDVFSMNGEGVRSAFRKASLESTRRLYFSHNQVVIIGESAARQGIDSLLDVYLRNMDAREDVTVFLTSGKAGTLLSQLSPSEWNPGNGLRKMIDMQQRQNSQIRGMRIFDVIEGLLGPTQSTAIPEIRLSGPPDSISSVEVLKRTRLDARLKLGRVGLVKRNKLVGWATLRESFGMMWLSDKIGQASLSYDCTGRDGAHSSMFLVRKASTETVPYAEEGRIRMKVNVEARGVIEDYACKTDLTKPDEVKRQEKFIADEITSVIRKGWEAEVRMKTDSIGFGAKIYERYPRLWKELKGEWEEQFIRIDPEIQVNVHIQGTGSSNSTIASYQDKQ
jgi:spore germination protein KC